ncbi:hypothetical protein CKAN_00869700 [Cinnamomum micranthum f. kanehirae]|uniref:Uncharacterized protein n=1 Tax=Cinnamomum micranthum f. kanehirae TaxID=337451 RepID=A0A443NNH4_9MAGN|nr:hypothetical protein CKAN_00869700 [Cinnamomum micranthum f. kanehirae]
MKCAEYKVACHRCDLHFPKYPLLGVEHVSQESRLTGEFEFRIRYQPRRLPVSVPTTNHNDSMTKSGPMRETLFVASPTTAVSYLTSLSLPSLSQGRSRAD